MTPAPAGGRTIRAMTTKSEFTEQEWDNVLSGPPMAGMMVITADHGGMMRETFAMAKAYGEARQQHGKSELLDEIVTAKPERDHTRFHSYDELSRHGQDVLREAVATLEGKATAEEVDDYRRFVVALARRVAERHKEDGVAISPKEQVALDDIAAALG
jgi:hypothetical protein